MVAKIKLYAQLRNSVLSGFLHVTATSEISAKGIEKKRWCVLNSKTLTVFRWRSKSREKGCIYIDPATTILNLVPPTAAYTFKSSSSSAVGGTPGGAVSVTAGAAIAQREKTSQRLEIVKTVEDVASCNVASVPSVGKNTEPPNSSKH